MLCRQETRSLQACADLHMHVLQAKKMVYEVRQAPTAGNRGKRKRELKEDIAMAARSNEAVEVVPNLDPLPKWALVQNILEVCTASGFLVDPHKLCIACKLYQAPVR